ncbi:S26 family signal peptidase [Sphingomonas sp. PB4P5]|uniref:S26 family signal peptidase n=1 Tax=Parasphingomonas puruogangriensis TaxID=3096155 RepID=UPI002FC7EBD0
MKRFGIMLTACCAISAVVAPASTGTVPRLVWNLSASVPIGLYAARVTNRIDRGELVAVYPLAPIARLMADRHYLPLRVPMLKRVAAVAGQTVCRTGTAILIDARHVAEALPRDRMGRLLPRWSGCRTLPKGQVFLLNPASATSFDGRYFGPVATHRIVAVLRPLWLPGGRAAVPASAPARRESTPHPNTKEPRDDKDR